MRSSVPIEGGGSGEAALPTSPPALGAAERELPAPGAARHRVGARGLLACVLLGAAAWALLLVCFSPSWVTFRAWSRAPDVFSVAIEVRRAANVLHQVDDPGAAIADPLHRIVQWRLLIPVLGKVLNLPAPALLGLAHLGSLLLLVSLTYGVMRRGLPLEPGGHPHPFPAADAFALAIVFGAGGWFFTSTGWLGYYDVFVVMGLLVAALARAPWAVAAACLLAPWVDERFILGLPFAMVVRWAVFSAETRARPLLAWALRNVALPASLALAYSLLRLQLAGAQGSPSLSTYMSWVAFGRLGFGRLCLGAWEGLRVGWIPLLAGVAALWWQRRRAAALALGIATAATTVVGLATSNDLSRSMMLLLPAVPVGWSFARQATPWVRYHAPWVLAAAALLLPAHHVVSAFSRPVWGLWYELSLLREPPEMFAPETYMDQAARAFDRGDYPQGEAYARLAVRLAPDSAAARNVLGILLARQGKLQQGIDELIVANRLEPSNTAYRDNLRRFRARLQERRGPP